VHEALYEFVDNSEVANASEICIRAEKGDKNPVERIVVADNGDGMSADGMVKALVFAGDREREPTEISEFGVGMKAAAFSLANEFILISKGCEGNIVGSYLDRNKVNKKPHEYEDPFESNSTHPYKELWEKYAVNKDSSGTIVILESLLQTTYSDCSNFIKGIRNPSRLATRYRTGIDSGRLSIYTVNGGRGQKKQLPSHDPLYRNDESTTVVINQSFRWAAEDVPFDFCLTRLSKGTGKEFGIFIKVAGITMYRDSRSLLGIFNEDTSHSYHWRLRGEIDFATKDDFLKVMSFASHKHMVQMESKPFSDWLRDTDIGNAYKIEKALRQEERQEESALNERAAFEAANDKFVQTLNTRKESYGSHHTLRERYFGNVKGIEPGRFDNPSDYARFEDGIVIYNSGNPHLATLFGDKSNSKAMNHQAGRSLATASALQADLEQSHQGKPSWPDYQSFVANLLAMNL